LRIGVGAKAEEDLAGVVRIDVVIHHHEANAIPDFGDG